MKIIEDKINLNDYDHFFLYASYPSYAAVNMVGGAGTMQRNTSSSWSSIPPLYPTEELWSLTE